MGIRHAQALHNCHGGVRPISVGAGNVVATGLMSEAAIAAAIHDLLGPLRGLAPPISGSLPDRRERTGGLG
jgi:hypothetical protein